MWDSLNILAIAIFLQWRSLKGSIICDLHKSNIRFYLLSRVWCYRRVLFAFIYVHVFSWMIYSRRRLCRSSSHVTGSANITGFDDAHVWIGVCTYVCVCAYSHTRVFGKPREVRRREKGTGVKTRREYVPAVIDCSPKPSFHKFLFIYVAQRDVSRTNMCSAKIVFSSARGWVGCLGCNRHNAVYLIFKTTSRDRSYNICACP